MEVAAAAGGASKSAHKDVLDPTAAPDPEYQAVVKEIVTASAQTGSWLTGRGGAFERQDIQYLSEHTEAERAKEQDLQTLESYEFAKLRSRLAENADAGAGASEALRIALREKKDLRPASKLLPTLKVLSPSASGLLSRDGSGALPNGREGSAKRARTGSSELPEQDAAAAAAAAGDQGGAEAAAKRAKAQQQEQAPEEADQGPGLLGGLLGGYGSSSDDEDGKAAKDGPGAAGKGTGSGLPSAAELLADDEDDAGGRVPLHWQQQQGKGGGAGATKKAAGGSSDDDDSDEDSSD